MSLLHACATKPENDQVLIREWGAAPKSSTIEMPELCRYLMEFAGNEMDAIGN